MNKSARIPTFRRQMAAAMAELQLIMSSGESPTGDGRLKSHTTSTSPDRREPSDGNTNK
jgi:hypothetical protein